MRRKIRTVRSGDVFKDIDGDFSVSMGTLTAGNLALQIRSIVSVELVSLNNYGRTCLELVLNFLIAGIVSAYLVGWLGVVLVVGAFGLVFYLLSYSWYELHMVTNATSIFRLKAKDEQFLRRVKSIIEAAMQRSDTVSYRLCISKQTIVEAEPPSARSQPLGAVFT